MFVSERTLLIERRLILLSSTTKILKFFQSSILFLLVTKYLNLQLRCYYCTMFISLIETLFQLIFFAPLGVGVNEENQSVNFGRYSNYIDIQVILNFIILLLFS